MRFSTVKCASAVAALMITLGANVTQAAPTNSLLPPTQLSTANGCNFSLSPWPQVLFFNGSNNSTLPRGATTINCFYGLSVQPTTGDLFLGSPAQYGATWTNNAPDYGVGIHFSGYSGENTDDIYFKRANLAKDLSELRLVIADNATSPYPYGDNKGVGDAFVIGATDYTDNYKWYPRATFTSNGMVGIGTQTPSQRLEVAGIHGDEGFIYNNKPEGGFLFGTQGRHSGGGLGLASADGEWANDSRAGDVTLRALQGGGINFSTSSVVGPDSGNTTYTKMHITNNGDVGVGTVTPAGNVDIENTTSNAKLCLNGGCVTSLTPKVDEVIAVTAIADSSNNYQQSSKAASARAHDFCVMTADQHGGLNSNCELYPTDNKPGSWTLQSDVGIAGSGQSGQTNCQMMCFNFN